MKIVCFLLVLPGFATVAAGEKPRLVPEPIPYEQWGPVHADAQYPQRDARLFRYVLPVPGHYINDHSLVFDGKRWHLIGIYGDIAGDKQTWMRPDNETRFCHAVSDDLLQWQMLEPAFSISDPPRLDSGHIYAPMIFPHEGKYYMFYTGLVEEKHGMRIFLAISDDLEHWQRHSDGPVFQSDPSWAAYRTEGVYGQPPGPCGCRDPHVIAHPDHGFVLYFAEHVKPDAARGIEPWEYAAIGAATSKDLVRWQDRGPVLVRHCRSPEVNFHLSPESPYVIRHNDRYYLFWKSGSCTRYVMSEDPLDFQNREEYVLATSHASEIVEWEGTWFVTSCSRLIDDVDHATSDRARGLYLAGIEWDSLWPRVRAVTGQ